MSAGALTLCKKTISYFDLFPEVPCGMNIWMFIYECFVCTHIHIHIYIYKMPVSSLGIVLCYSTVCLAGLANMPAYGSYWTEEAEEGTDSQWYYCAIANFVAVELQFCDNIRHWASCAKFSMFSAVLISSPLSSSSPLWEQAIFSGTVSMETCNYPRHQQFMLNNFISNQMGAMVAASLTLPVPSTSLSYVLISYISQQNACLWEQI